MCKQHPKCVQIIIKKAAWVMKPEIQKKKTTLKINKCTS